MLLDLRVTLEADISFGASKRYLQRALAPQLKKRMLSMAHRTGTAYKEDLYTDTQMISPEPDRRKTLVSLFRGLFKN